MHQQKSKSYNGRINNFYFVFVIFCIVYHATEVGASLCRISSFAVVVFRGVPKRGEYLYPQNCHALYNILLYLLLYSYFTVVFL